MPVPPPAAARRRCRHVPPRRRSGRPRRRGVEPEARPRGRIDAEGPHERLGAVVPGAHGDALRVEEAGDVVRMHPVDVERDDAAAIRPPRPVDGDALETLQRLERVAPQRAVVRPDLVEAHALEVVERGGEPDRLGDGRRARLEPHRDVGVGAAVDLDAPDHLAATEERRQRLEQVGPHPQRADPGRAPDLVARERVGVGAERLDVDRHVRRGLRAVDDEQGTHRVRGVGDGAQRLQRSEHVGDVVGRDDPGPRPDGGDERGQVDATVGVRARRRAP
jgi:hypothetical protein